MADIQIITTADGSHSLLHAALDETYHSRHGAVQESQYVFIEKGLDYFFENSRSSGIFVFEVGFGTGLNAWLTWRESRRRNISIHYASLEAYPLAEEIWSQLNYAQSDDDARLFRQLHAAPWNEAQALDAHYFSLHKLNTTLQDVVLQNASFDLVFYDAFAPSKQPDMWTLSMLEKTTAALRPRGVFVTYCAKGQLKRDLKSLGLTVETLPGPPGKKEMVRACKLS